MAGPVPYLAGYLDQEDQVLGRTGAPVGIILCAGQLQLQGNQ